MSKLFKYFVIKKREKPEWSYESFENYLALVLHSIVQDWILYAYIDNLKTNQVQFYC